MFWSFGVKERRVTDILDGQKGDRGGGPKMAKIQYGVKPDLFKITRKHTSESVLMVNELLCHRGARKYDGTQTLCLLVNAVGKRRERRGFAGGDPKADLFA